MFYKLNHMKRYIFGVLVLLIFPLVSRAQFFDYKQGLFARKTLMDYNTPRGLNSAAFRDYRNGFELAYIRNFKQNLSLAIPFGASIYQDSLVNCAKTPLVYIGAQGMYSFYKPNKWLVPYLVGGLNILVPKGKDLAIEVPLGLGLLCKLHPQAYINIQSDYRLAVSNWENHIQHSIGFIYMLGKKKMEEPKLEMDSKDSDGDGIPDELDLCPSQAGLAKFSGCPDTDGDGIEDNKDKCPETVGTIELQGCPDTDGDGISDNEDECPNVKGTIANKGCPDVDTDGDGVPDKADHCPDKAGLVSLFGCPDSDGDGISDKDDRCPNQYGSKAKGGCPETSKKDADNDGIDDEQDECPFTAGLIQFKGCPDTDGDGIQDKLDACPNNPGPASNKGCPIIEKADREVLDFAMRAVQFDLGKATLKPESFSILDKIAKIMRKYDAYGLAIGGHTDNTGSPAFNLSLSEKRAKVCYEYLISKDVEANRLSYTGYGASKPISENKTDNGRYLNRRTEFNLIPR